MTKFNVGLKIWASNRQYVAQVRQLSEKRAFDFLELYIDSEARESDYAIWDGVAPDIRLHAPHSYSGFNPAKPEMREWNLRLLENVERYRKKFSPQYIVFHPGISGRIVDSVDQFKEFARNYPEIFNVALIENKPRVGLKGEICLGAEPSEIRLLQETIGFGFCLDFSHAICYANWAELDREKVINEFLSLSPSLFHLSDGDWNSQKDEHRNFGKGSFDIPFLLEKIPSGSDVTIETPHNFEDNLADFCADVEYLKRIVKR